jgi:hypothetical protein
LGDASTQLDTQTKRAEALQARVDADAVALADAQARLAGADKAVALVVALKALMA